LIALVLTALPLGVTAQTEATNLLPNPGFEEPLTAWTPWGPEGSGIARDEGVAQSGRASARVPGGRAALYTYVPLTGGQAYRLSGYARLGEGARSATVRLMLCAADGANGSAGTRQVLIPARGVEEWLPFEQTLVISKETAQSQVTLSVEGGPGWFDDLALAPTAMPQWGEALAGGAWDGLRQARTAKPLYQELLGKQPGGYHVTMWAHALQRSSVPEPQHRELTDADWERETRLTFEQMGENRLGAMLLPWGIMGADTPEHFWRTDAFLRELHAKYGLRFDAAAESSAVAARAVVLGAEALNPQEVQAGERPVVSPVDPAYVQACREELRRLSEVLAEAPYVRTVVGEDEPSVPVIPGPRAQAGPLLRQMDEQVRVELGGGRYRMPAPADPEWQRAEAEQPLSWLAFNRWMADRYAKAAQEKHALVRQVASGWQYVPCDYWLMSGMIPFDYSRMAKYADVVQGDPYASSAERTPGRGMYNHGFGAKLLADLSRGTEGSDPKPVEIIVQAFDYAGYEVTPEDLLEWSSQALRCGATSLNFYASDNPRFTDGPRWRMMLHIAKTVGALPALERPAKARTAILYCTAAHAAEGASCSADEVYTAYALLGEKLGCWFDIIDDLQVARGLRRLSDYKVIYLPLATYADPELPQALQEWVEAGGTLVCGDPQAFSWAPDGSDLSPAREALFGVKLGEPVEQHALVVDGARLPLSPRRTATNPAFTAHAIEVASGVETLGSYPNGEPAFVARDVGEGSALYFAANPFTPANVLGDAPWGKVLEGLQKDAGETTGLDVWRFRLPANG